MDDIYTANILDHYRNPRHFGALAGASLAKTADNPSCGDRQTLFARADGEQLAALSFEGEGCAISQAATSMLLERMAGKTKADVRAMTEKDIHEMLGIPIGPSREGCAALGFSALRELCSE